MKMKLFALTVLAALSMGSARADQDWGMHAPTESASFSVSHYSSYDQYFLFSIDKTSNLKATATTISYLNKIGPNYVNLFNWDTEEHFGGFTFGITPTSAYFDNLAPGNYFYEVSGTNYGMVVEQVTFSSTLISAVPEPETYAMLLAGLGLMRFMSRRRKFL